MNSRAAHFLPRAHHPADEEDDDDEDSDDDQDDSDVTRFRYGGRSYRATASKLAAKEAATASLAALAKHVGPGLTPHAHALAGVLLPRLVEYPLRKVGPVGGPGCVAGLGGEGPSGWWLVLVGSSERRPRCARGCLPEASWLVSMALG